jgi:hypothetical protein
MCAAGSYQKVSRVIQFLRCRRVENLESGSQPSEFVKHVSPNAAPIDIQIDLCDTNRSAGSMPCPKSAILIEEEVVPKMDSSLSRSAVAALLALR